MVNSTSVEVMEEGVTYVLWPVSLFCMMTMIVAFSSMFSPVMVLTSPVLPLLAEMDSSSIEKLEDM